VTKIIFTLKAVTPLFMTGANDSICEFRASSLKGCIRYWFRAIYPHMLSQESRLFGDTNHRSPLIIRTRVNKGVLGQKGDQRWHNTSIAYLGYGAIARDRQVRKTITQKAFFDIGSLFELELGFKRSLNDEDIVMILHSVWALFMLSGIGSRSRRGFGAVRIADIQDRNQLCTQLPAFKFGSRNEWLTTTRSFLDSIQIADKEYPHTAFNKQMQLIVMHQKSTAMEALRNIGDSFQRFRSYIKDCQYPEDRDMMLNYLKNGNPPRIAPSRAAFGLPHNYFFPFRPPKSGNVDIMDNSDKNQRSQKGRRGSPLFIHVQEFENNAACGVFLFLPAPLIPKKQKIRLSGSRVRPCNVDPPDFSGVTKYLDHLVKKGGERLI
jgi:CRISPR-associated protein Cmr1